MGSSSSGMAFDAKEAEFEKTSFIKPPKTERWEIIRHLQRIMIPGIGAVS
jgi:hypothetical protein